MDVDTSVCQGLAGTPQRAEAGSTLDSLLEDSVRGCFCYVHDYNSQLSVAMTQLSELHSAFVDPLQEEVKSVR